MTLNPICFISAAIIMMAVACNNSADTATDGIDSSDSFEHYRLHIKETLAGADSLTRFFYDSIVINEGGKNRPYHFNIANESMWSSFQLSFYADQKLFLYNIDRKNIALTINFAKQNPDRKRMNCYVKDSQVFVIKEDEHTLYRFDITGRLLHSYHLADSSKELGCALTPFPLSSDLVVNKNMDMPLYMLPYLNGSKKEDRIKGIKDKPVWLMHLEGNNISVRNKAGTFPREYIDHYYHETYYRFIRLDDSNIAYIFRIKPEITVENVYTNNIQKYKVKGLPVNKLFPYSDNPDIAMNFSYTQEYELKNDDYSGLSFDKDKKRFYLFRRLAIPPVMKDGLLATYEDHPVILYIIDAANFSVIRKLYCGLSGEYWYNRPVIYKSKLFLTRSGANRKGAPAIIDAYDIP